MGSPHRTVVKPVGAQKPQGGPVPERSPGWRVPAPQRTIQRRSRYLFLTLGLCALVPLLWAARHGHARSETLGWATVLPGSAHAGTWNTQQVVYTVGSAGVAQGGGLKVQLPKSWILSASQGLSLDPAEDYYVSASTSVPAAYLLLGVVNSAIDGRRDILDWTAVMTVTGSSLVEGDVITCTLGDTSGGGRGIRAAAKADTESVGVAVEPSAGGEYLLLDDLPVVEAVSGAADSLLVVAPSQATAGRPVSVTLVVQDENLNAAHGYGGTISFGSTDPLAVLPPPYTFTPADGSIHTFEITLNTPGPAWITATDALLWPEGVSGNPILCREGEPELGLFWGDVHSHTDLSVDARGRLAGAFEYARTVARLDFYAPTDHSYPTGGYTPEEWTLNQSLVAQYDAPGAFVTLLGYEWTAVEPAGHRTVLFREAAHELVSAEQYPSLEALWSELKGEQALTIPHHTGKQWRDGTTATVEWDPADDALQRSIEIYSSHGQSELYDPSHPLSYENVGSPGVLSVPGPHYAQDGWAAGRPLGVIAGGDEHSARPGQASRGLTAVLAPELTREAVFDAMAAGHSYATTGQRIYLDFRVDGLLMGSVLTVTLPHSPCLEVEVAGTDVLSYVEIVKYDGITYTVPYSVTGIQGRHVAFTWTDSGLGGNALYYVRLAQTPLIGERTVMAWSSPVWVAAIPEHRPVFLPLAVHRR